jgi:hypothetical protein
MFRHIGKITVCCLLAMMCGLVFSHIESALDGYTMDGKDLRDFIEFVRPVRGGYEVLQIGSGDAKMVQVGGRSWISSLTPDLSGYYYISIDRQADLLSLNVQLHGLQEKTSYKGRWEREHPGVASLAWAAPDGQVYFVLAESTLHQWSACGANLTSSLVMSGVKAFTFTSDRMFWIPQDAPRKLRWREWSRSEPLEFDLPLAYQHILASSNDQVFLYDSDPRNEAWKTHFAVAGINEGRVASLTLPIQGKVFDLVPIRSSPVIAVEVWSGGRERLDGTELTEFEAWDYRSNKTMHLRDNDKMYQMHGKPEDVHSIQPVCR